MPSGVRTPEVAQRLREIREAINPNATDFARQAGIAQNAYSQYETGARLLTLTAAVKLCDRYRLTLDWLYRGDPAFMPDVLIDRLRAPETRPRRRRVGG